MENASKALLLAAAILIAIILISLGVYIVNQGSEVVGQGGQALDEVSIQTFNGKFDIYEGTITGSKVKQLIKTVNTSNTSNPNQLVIINLDGKPLNEVKDGKATTASTSGLGTQAKYEVTTELGASGLIEIINVKKVKNATNGNS